MTINKTKNTVAFHTLGCKLNFAETSSISRIFLDNNYDIVDFNSKADIYVVNSCSVTNHADKKSRQAISKIQNNYPDAFIVMTGCYAQLKSQEASKIPGVNLVLGTKYKFDILDIINEIRNKEQKKVYSCDISDVKSFNHAHSESDRTRAFLKVQDGCNYNCTYCTIPLARGKSRSPKIFEILTEAKKIAESNIQEIILTGVNIGDFGQGTNENFFQLIIELDKIEGIERIRISSIEPNLLTNEVIDFVAKSKKILPHFHVPLQSGCDEILKKMQRRYNTSFFKTKIAYIKQQIPEAFIGIDVIVGFPGETDEYFNSTFKFLSDIDASFYHVFSYSERANTETANMSNKVQGKIIKERSNILNKLANNKLLQFYNSNLQKESKVLFEATNK
ncbi:MAG: tRNA (N(6)-L-threonylcarbamoyladenosine(37)-C(2))-methylthiotransferase MtaB, partial [Bacteroidales bacterium]|nr:tRNA (N(6)-L-threonylcarbamoyladenosine(37)-C(2))-methylthiotransferase MtaB [Bacteroidales bacterium]